MPFKPVVDIEETDDKEVRAGRKLLLFDVFYQVFIGIFDRGTGAVMEAADDMA